MEGLEDLIRRIPQKGLVVLAGRPGTGKTAFAVRFLASSSERGIFVSFSESRDSLVANTLNHQGIDLNELEREEKIRILDFATVRDTGVSAALDTVVDEIRTFGAKRLVVDSISAISQAFREEIDRRILLHTLIGRVVRNMGVTSLLIVEGEAVGLEGYVADGVFTFTMGELEGRIIRELEISKLRGTELTDSKILFTLHKGFNILGAMGPEAMAVKKRFEPLPDKDERVSSGIPDLDSILGGGYPRGGVVLLEVGEEVPAQAYEIIVRNLVANLLNQGRGVYLIPHSGQDARIARSFFDGYVDEDVYDKRFRIAHYGGGEVKDYMVKLTGRQLLDFDTSLKTIQGIKEHTDLVCMVIGWDMVEYAYPTERHGLLQSMSLLIANIRYTRDLAFIFTKAGASNPESLAQLRNISDVHLKLRSLRGTPILYGVKPPTSANSLVVEREDLQARVIPIL